MPYALISDTFATDPLWLKLAGKRGPLYDTLKASYVDLLTHASHHLSNGYLTAEEALELCRGKRQVLEKLCTSELGKPPMVHRQDDECSCLGGEWVDGYAYRIHGFLKRNPARAEVERNRAMKADRKDHRLRALVYERDGGCCRYCRSGPLPPNAGRSKDRRKVRAFDHVNPDAAAGPGGEGYVVACDRCNTEKGHRLPQEADMVLLDEPTEAERAAWLTRDLVVFDRSENAPETLRERCEPPRSDRDPDRDPAANADAIPADDSMGDVHPEQADADRDPGSARSGNPPGSGRVAGVVHPGREPPPRRALQDQPQRTSAEPDIYTRRSRASPPEHLGWPAGSVPATPRSTEEERPPWT